MRLDETTINRLAMYYAGQITDDINRHVETHPLTYGRRALGEDQFEEIRRRVEVGLAPVIAELEIERRGPRALRNGT